MEDKKNTKTTNVKKIGKFLKLNINRYIYIFLKYQIWIVPRGTYENFEISDIIMQQARVFISCNIKYLKFHIYWQV